MKKALNKFLSFFVIALTFNMEACTHKVQEEAEVAKHLPHFELTDQNGNAFTNASVKNKYIISAFFFTGCPSICPKMTTQMKRVAAAIGKDERFLILYHSIDPERDTQQKLNFYTLKNNLPANWKLLRGDTGNIYMLANYYLVRAGRDKNDASGFIHSGSFVMTDQSGIPNKYYNGLDSTSVHELIHEIKNLKKI
ncbi:MAG: SCO family protein [Ferruginibacter sp.]|nr:SCO family protein [Ferruginibacter sp.]